MSVTAPPAAPHTGRRTGRWIDDWRPEDPEFWESTGAPVARRNLIWSILAEHLGFSVWLFWSVSAALLVKVGFEFSVSQLFLLVAVPNLVGSLLRLPYTFAVPKFGGRNWTVVSALLLLVPTLLFATAVQDPTTPYWVFLLIAATAGVGGGNFASSMANINFFYPAKRKGLALGLNAAGGNIGVAVLQLGLPIVVGGAGLFGLVKASSGGLHLARAGYLYAALAVVAAIMAYFFMDNLSSARSNARDVASVVTHKHTWVMSFLYIGTFGSFIGYSAALPLLIKLEFFVPEPLPTGTGINFAYYAFLGALVGSITRPFGGWLADKYGGARVTLATFGAMILGTLGVLWTVTQLAPNPTADPAIALDNKSMFPLFLVAFLFVFAATGIGNGSTFRMIPAIWKRDTKKSSAVIGIASAVGALGGFLIPLAFGAPWIDNPVESVKTAFGVFTAFYVVCLVVTWAVYVRKASVARVAGLADARI
ncbi:NNP family nitrate/nitrite transporter-like MFS transporter [Nocardioides ginsengisegetis]|uniref:NNP family nitrate/nitrite transporter-like MFS transporter n=1 Tax=Nocardioides ginsengisegetis TaxID=661491 RepID=A0A7W3IWK6_9ACTN|nr:nitrate/nitrite transporter [Nocardioides ginsengisegetis]MBA8801904.1 NNP family nitrate/nitrite transporter-like MFS transporter [Nocardioides ginsengisegetis]